MDTEAAFAGPAISQAVTRAHGKSFYFASKVLPSFERQNSYDLYALCRIIDDATDLNHEANGHAFSSTLVDFLYSDAPTLDSVLAQKLAALINGSTQLQLQANEASNHLCYLRQRLKDLGISKRHLQDLLQGQLEDEHFEQPTTFEAFYGYCYLVAGVVGHMMALVLGASRDRATQDAAEHLGIAMQITNILRDIKEDRELRQRIYVPRDLCNRYGIDFSAPLSSLANQPQANSLIHDLGHTGLEYYVSGVRGAKGIRSLRGRICVKLMAAIYGSILAQVLEQPSRVFHHRVMTSWPSKVWIALQVILGRHALRAAGFRSADLRAAEGTLAQAQLAAKGH